ncbi:Tetratricopeptide repeat protein [Orpheovirus IHUMI-LCC2]|uniref:Tetratricopeptide repeat protein n=1 Tax=Orpheovirus IHUMI-LCC2 TaxID=2023057 RepID=A0A2I2L442_9VIRU|nr:Tetratricopeptide repeat protein [Orpheovirus IHUMI-LCC2]SNW62280.1 Tetratricopeptide repeat protein [Orpheovirus IHUMI-LCC2]
MSDYNRILQELEEYKLMIPTAKSNHEACITFQEIGDCYYALKNYELAIENYNNALNKCKYTTNELNEDKRKKFYSNILCDIASAYNMLKNNKAVDYYYNNAIKADNSNVRPYRERSKWRQLNEDYIGAASDLKMVNKLNSI